MFIAIPVGMNYRTERLPVVTFSLIGVNTAVWVISMVVVLATEGSAMEWILRNLWLVPANCTWCAPLTSMFVHAGPLHLVGNMIFLFLFGAVVEDIIGRLRFLIFYLLGGLVAELVFVAMTPEHFQSTMPMGGASGAISACMGMYLILRAGADMEFKYFVWLYVYVRAGGFEVPAWVAILFYFLSDLISAIFGLFSGPAGGGGVAFGAHVGGFLGGLALATLYRWRHKAEEEEPEPAGPILDPAAALAAARAAAAARAPSAEVANIYLHDGVTQSGPFTLTAVQGMLQRGEVGRETSYWSEGMTDWQNVVELSAQPME